MLWGVLYLVPFAVVLLLVNADASPGWGALAVLLMFGVGVASIFHAFRLRGDYLRRLETLESGDATAGSAFRSYPANTSASNSVEEMPNKLPEKAVDVPAISIPYDELFRVCAGYDGASYYVGEAIGKKRLTNAHMRFPIPDTERVIALIDTSIFLNGKTGLALCEGGSTGTTAGLPRPRHTGLLYRGPNLRRSL